MPIAGGSGGPRELPSVVWDALARDFLRSLRKGFLVSPPSLERLRELAEHAPGPIKEGLE